MARITVEDCLKNVDNRFELIHLVAIRVRQLKKGVEPLAICKNKNIVTALREIASGQVFPKKKEEEDVSIKNNSGLSPKGLPDQLTEENTTQKQGDHENTVEGK